MRFFESSLERIARIITQQYGVQILFEGSQAYTNGKKIVLPALPKEGVDAEFASDIQGYLDHEAAHCIFSDFTVMHKIKSQYHHYLSNHCEDARIEVLMVKKYSGCSLHLDPLNDKWNKITIAKWDTLDRLTRAALTVRAIMEGHSPTIDADLLPLFTSKVMVLSKLLRKAATTLQVIKICGAIIKEFDSQVGEQEKQKQEKKEEKKKQKQKQEEGKGEKSESGKGKSEDQDGKAGEGQGEKDDGEGKDDDKKDGEAGGEGKPEGESKDGKGEQGKASGVSAAEEKELLNESPAPANNGQVQSREMNKFEPSSEATDIHSFMDKEIKEKIEEQKPAATRSYDFENVAHVPASTAEDVLYDRTKDGPKVRPEYQALKREINSSITKTVIELERMLKVKENARTVFDQERGALNRARLHSLITDPNFRRPFTAKTRVETTNVSIMFLCDVSGSMREGDKMERLRETVAILGESLKQLRIEFEVIGFTTGTTTKFPSYDARLTRHESLQHYLYKSFESEDMAPIINMTPMGCNCDGESLRFAARRLSERRTKRKIMFVLSDGFPNPSCGGTRIRAVWNADLKKAVAEVSKFGIEVVGFGILTDAVKNFYKDYVVIQDVTSLLTAVRTKLRKILTA